MNRKLITRRIGKDTANLLTAGAVALRGACRRRRVGCVLVDANNHILATGYNGRESGAIECLDVPCEGAFSGGSGTNLDKCLAIHAEANALIQCNDAQEIRTAYITTAPCIHCIKLLTNTACTRIVYAFDYPGSDVCEDLWLEQVGRTWMKLDLETQLEETWSLSDSI